MLLGATGTGKTATTAWLVEELQRPTLVMAPNKTLAAQLANEFRELLPRQRGRVLRLVLRLLPARGVHPADRHLHREGLLDQRGGRAAAPLGHEQPAHPPRRASWWPPCPRIYGLGTPQEYVDRMVRAARRGGVRPRRSCCGAFVDIQYTRNDIAFTRGTFRVRGRHRRGFPVVRGARGAHRVVRRRDRAAHDAAPAHRRDPHARTDEMYVFPATHYVAGPERMERAIGGDRGRARGAAGRAGASGQAARGPAAAHAHDVRHRDDAPGRLVRRHRELLAAHRRSRAGQPAQLPARLLPRRLPHRARRVARDGARRSAPCTRAT